jgi:hypothetical protein
MLCVDPASGRRLAAIMAEIKASPEAWKTVIQGLDRVPPNRAEAALAVLCGRLRRTGWGLLPPGARVRVGPRHVDGVRIRGFVGRVVADDVWTVDVVDKRGKRRTVRCEDLACVLRGRSS